MRHLACYVTVASALLLAPAQLGLAEVSRPNAVVNQAHTSHKAVGRAETRRAMRDQINSQLVGLVLGGMDDSDLVQAADLIATLDRINLRILPVAGVAAKQNLTDLLLARGIDIAILQTDVLELLKREPPFPGADNFLRYITRLYNQEVHILADGEIRSLEDLTSKKVNFGLSDGGTSFTASALFSALGINLQITNFSQTVALDKLRAGEISALVYVTGKPARLFEAVRPDEGLHFLSIPKDGRLLSSYTEASLTAEDYPELIENGKPIGVLAVGTILAAYNWPSGSDRYRKVARFVGTLFQRFDQLRNPPHHPKWREVDIRSELPGWGRFA